MVSYLPAGLSGKTFLMKIPAERGKRSFKAYKYIQYRYSTQIKMCRPGKYLFVTKYAGL